jgi:hypothetical protein
MLDAHGALKVLDFGLAAGAPDAAADGPIAQTSLAGTPLYMAPEQARGEAIDCRADIYALGATLYHLVSGAPPFAAESADELRSLHATAARPALPRRGQARTQIGAIDALCARMMAPRPEDRFASYDELLRAIELASTTRTLPAGFWVRTMATGLDLVLVVVLFVLFGFLLSLVVDTSLSDNGEALFPALGVYQALAVARWGRGLGKAVFELEVVDVATSRRPPVARAVRRALVMYGPPTLAAWCSRALEAAGRPQLANVVGGAALLMVPLGLALLLYATMRNTSKRAVWDRASATLVRYRRSTSTAVGSV